MARLALLVFRYRSVCPSAEKAFSWLGQLVVFLVTEVRFLCDQYLRAYTQIFPDLIRIFRGRVGQLW